MCNICNIFKCVIDDNCYVSTRGDKTELQNMNQKSTGDQIIRQVSHLKKIYRYL